MTSDTYNQAVHDVQTASESVAAEGEAVVNETIASAQRTFADAVKQLQSVLKDAIDALDTRARPYVDSAVEQVDEARHFVVDNVKTRPLSTALVGLAAGVVLGVVLARREA